MRHAWLLVAILGCGIGDEPVAMKVQEGHAPTVGRRAKAPPINALEPYERLVRAFERCALEGNQIVSTCSAVPAFATEMQGVSPEIVAKVGARMIGHASPAVRVQAAVMASPDVVARAAVAERDPRVLAAFIRIAGKHGARHPRVAAMLVGAAHHPDAGVRLDAVAALAAQAGVAGAAAQLVALAETDADPRVRRAACEHAGRLGGDVVLALYERTTERASDPALTAACLEGLAGMVTSSEAAYRLLLRRVAEHAPPWTVMAKLGDLAHAPRGAWFDAAEVRRALAAVIADRAASTQARSAAIESLVVLEVTPDELAALKKQLTAAADRPLLDKLVAICAAR